MKIVELILLVFTVVAVALFFSLVSGGAELMMIALTLVSTFYFFLGLVFFSRVRLRTLFKGGLKNTPVTVMLASIVSGVALSNITIGILFKLLIFPGADNMLVAGTVLSVIILGVYAIYYFSRRNAIGTLAASRLVPFVVIAIILLVTPSLTLVKMQYRNHPNYIEAYKNYELDPENPATRKALNLERNRIVLSPEEFEVYKRSVE